LPFKTLSFTEERLLKTHSLTEERLLKTKSLSEQKAFQNKSHLKIPIPHYAQKSTVNLDLHPRASH